MPKDVKLESVSIDMEKSLVKTIQTLTLILTYM